MKTARPFGRVLQIFSDKKLSEFRDMPVQARLRWIENARILVYGAYVASGRQEVYDPQSWPYL